MNKKENFAAIYKNYSAEIFRFCSFSLNNREQAEDITAEVFISLYGQDLNSINNPRAWLYKSAKNKMINLYKKHKSISIDSIDENTIQSVSALSVSNVETNAIDQVSIEFVEQKIQELDASTKEIIIMRLWDEMTYAQIAEVFNKSEDAVRKRFDRGITMLKKLVSTNSTIKPMGITSILGAIILIAKQPAYAFTAEVSANIAKAVGLNLSINLLSMSEVSGAAGTTVASAGGATAATAVAGGLLATTGAKILAVIVGGLALVGGGVGVAVIANNNNTSNPVTEEPPQVQEQAINLTKTCTLQQPVITAKLPENWECEQDKGVANGHLKGDGFDIRFAFEGFGPACIVEGMDQTNCKQSSFLTAKNTSVDIFQDSTKGKAWTYGEFKKNPRPVIFSISHEDLFENNFTSEQKELLTAILDNLVLDDGGLVQLTKSCKFNTLEVELMVPVDYTCEDTNSGGQIISSDFRIVFTDLRQFNSPAIGCEPGRCNTERVVDNEFAYLDEVKDDNSAFYQYAGYYYDREVYPVGFVVSKGQSSWLTRKLNASEIETINEIILSTKVNTSAVKLTQTCQLEGLNASIMMPDGWTCIAADSTKRDYTISNEDYSARITNYPRGFCESEIIKEIEDPTYIADCRNVEIYSSSVITITFLGKNSDETGEIYVSFKDSPREPAPLAASVYKKEGETTTPKGDELMLLQQIFESVKFN